MKYQLISWKTQKAFLFSNYVSNDITIVTRSIKYHWASAEPHGGKWQGFRHILFLILELFNKKPFGKDNFASDILSLFQALPLRLEGSDTLVKSPLESFLRYRMPKKLQEEKKLERGIVLSLSERTLCVI